MTIEKSAPIFERQCGPYIIRHEMWKHTADTKAPPILMKSAYSPEGLYIGQTLWAYRLWKKYGIVRFEKASADHNVVSIGWSDKKAKWFGWSHRAIHGFAKGQLKRKGHMPNEEREYVISNPKRAAISFAREVS